MTDTNTRWRKKPVVIDAVRFLGIVDGLPSLDVPLARDVPSWLTTALNDHSIEITPMGCLAVHSLEGVMSADKGDWIIRGVKGELYPCKPDIFEATYEPANEGEPIAADEQAYHDEHIRFSIRNSALAFALQNQGKGGNPKNLIVAAQTFAEFLEGAANDPGGLGMRDGSPVPPHVARMLIEYEQLDDRRKRLAAFFDTKMFAGLPLNEREAMRDQHAAMEDYYAALMRRLAYAGAMTS
jgi:hypothetical protein